MVSRREKQESIVQGVIDSEPLAIEVLGAPFRYSSPQSSQYVISMESSYAKKQNDIKRTIERKKLNLAKERKLHAATIDKAQLPDPALIPGGVHPNALPATTSDKGDWQFPEFNFSEVTSILDTESIVRQGLERKEVLALKEGWDLVGKNPNTVQYVRQRLHEIAQMTRVPTDELVRQIVSDLIRYSNSFTVFVRDSKKSSGMGRRGKKPIAGLFTLPMTTAIVQYNSRGHIQKVSQSLFGYSANRRVEAKIFEDGSYAHFVAYDDRATPFGVPILVPVKDDISALRRLEEDMEILYYQYLFPLFKYQVGTETAPARTFKHGGESWTELDDVRTMWSTLPSEGAIVIPERHAIDVIGAKAHALDPMPGIEHYKKRVASGLGISLLDIGEGDTANRSTSDTLSETIVDGCKFLQSRVECQFDTYIIRELLLESTFPEDEVLMPENMVHFVFREIDMNYLIKKEEHASQMFNTHGLTQGEFRNQLGKEPLSEEEFQDTLFKKIQEVMQLMSGKSSGSAAEAYALAGHPSSSISEEHISKEQQAAQQAVEQQAKAKAAANTGSSGADKQVASRMRPSNQHGTKSGPEGRKSSLQLSHFISDNVKPYKEKTAGELTRQWTSAQTRLVDHRLGNNTSSIYATLSMHLRLAVDSMTDSLIGSAFSAMQETLRRDPIRGSRPSISETHRDTVRTTVNRLVNSLLTDLKNKLTLYDERRLFPREEDHDKVTPLDIANTLKFRTKFIDYNEGVRAYNLGLALGYRKLGYKQVAVVKASDHSQVLELLDLENLHFSHLPPVSHPNAHETVMPVESSKDA